MKDRFMLKFFISLVLLSKLVVATQTTLEPSKSRLTKPAQSESEPIILEVKNKSVTVNGKQVSVYTIEQPNGTWGYYGKPNTNFNVIVKNKIKEPTVIHWHGLLLPNNQDGTELTQKAIAPGGEHHYKFKLKQSGTYWMHSHYGLQEQKFAEAPLIIDDGKYPQQAVILFQDFSFKDPEQIMRELKSGGGHDMAHGDMSDHDMSKMGSSAPKMDMSKMKMDLNDVKYDAFLTNYQNLNNPQVITVKPGKVRLRFINGAASTNFWVNLGKLRGSLIAVDGEDIKPFKGRQFQIGMGQRLDILINIPKSGGSYYILGQVEGLKNQTGILLTTKLSKAKSNATLEARREAKALNYDQERRLVSKNNLPTHKIDQVVKLELDGNMTDYVWTVNKQEWPKVTPITVKQNERIALDIKNNSQMSHPIHLHGSIFKVVAIDGKSIKGTLRDTVMVMPNSTLRIIFDVTESGKWMIHCHMLYHMHAGMMTYLNVLPLTAK
jgi:FtsP/CotA-like multicopper oxidase with cupredoxin domain